MTECKALLSSVARQCKCQGACHATVFEIFIMTRGQLDWYGCLKRFKVLLLRRIIFILACMTSYTVFLSLQVVMMPTYSV